MLALFTATVLAACGGKVVVDGPGSSGAGGTGGGSTSTFPSTGTFPPPDTGPTTGTGPSDLCAELCTFWQNANCPMNDCPGQCAILFQTAGSCTPELTAEIQCILAHPDQASSCGKPSACDATLLAYGECIAPQNGCDNQDCFESSDGSCGCKGTCNGLNVDVECKDSLCTCNANGKQVGICKEAAPTCDPQGGCCASVFFPQEG